MDTVELTLPHSKKVVTLRNYTTHKDDQAAEAVLYAGVNSNKSGEFEFPIANVMAMNEVYSRRLVQAIDGDDNRSHVETAIDELHSKDFEAIEKKVAEIVDENSPKAQGVLSGSEINTTKK